MYNFDNLENIDDSDIHLTIDFDLFLEMILLRIRGETIKYASFKKKKTLQKEQDLIQNIETLEQINPQILSF